MAKMCAVEKNIMKNGKSVVVCDETRAALLPILQDIQKKKGYISDDDMQTVADRLGIHPVEVYSVVTFYSFLKKEKQGRHVIRISQCISNVMAGSDKIVKAFEKALKIKVGETTKDNKVTLEMTNCIGMCDQAPAIMVDDELIGGVTPQSVRTILNKMK
ncbi:MAG: NADH-quinone oxidoreductase subunit NuoE [Candidatus Omnitrophota bacterium]